MGLKQTLTISSNKRVASHSAKPQNRNLTTGCRLISFSEYVIYRGKKTKDTMREEKGEIKGKNKGEKERG